MAANQANKKRSRPRLRWYFNGVIIIIAALVLMAYLGFIQASQAYVESSGSVASFQSAFIESTIKSSVLIVAAAVFVFFFSIQDYQTTIERLMETLTENLQDGSTDSEAQRPGSRSSSMPSALTHSDELMVISQSVKSIIEEKDTYIEQLALKEQIIFETLVTQLMKGWVNYDQAAVEICKSHGLLLEQVYFQVLVFSDADDLLALAIERMRTVYPLLKEILDAFTQNLCKIYGVEIDGRFALLLMPMEGEDLFDTITASDLHTMVKLSLQLLYQEYGVSLKAAIGSVSVGIPGVARSYAEAIEALQYTDLIGDEGRVSTFSAENKLLVHMIDVAEYVKSNYQDQNLSVATTASHFDLNPSYLSRTFKRIMNVGLAAYIQHVRVEAATELLKDEQISVKQAAEAVGFSNTLTMNRAFHKQVGTTAGQIRQRGV